LKREEEAATVLKKYIEEHPGEKLAIFTLSHKLGYSVLELNAALRKLASEGWLKQG